MSKDNNKSIDEQIDELPMHEMTGEEALKMIDPNSFSHRITRRDVRYKLYCKRTEAENAINIAVATKVKEKHPKVKIPRKVVLPKIDKEFVKLYEEQDGFDGWKNFATTWDVALHDATVVVSRAFSEAEEWDRVVRAKFPKIEPGGKIVYPDMAVKKAVDAEAELQAK